MIKELRKMRAKGGHERAKANYIAGLQGRNKLRKIISPKGYLAYDTEELAEYQKYAHRGRPIKIKGEM